jgi:hypothetical protein
LICGFDVLISTIIKHISDHVRFDRFVVSKVQVFLNGAFMFEFRTLLC